MIERYLKIGSFIVGWDLLLCDCLKIGKLKMWILGIYDNF